MCDWARASYRPRLHTSNHVVVHVFTRRIKGQGIHYFKILLDGQTLRSEPFSPLRGNSYLFVFLQPLSEQLRVKEEKLEDSPRPWERTEESAQGLLVPRMMDRGNHYLSRCHLRACRVTPKINMEMVKLMVMN